jgi:hypothetical protein
MLRAIVAVIVGDLAMIASLFVLFTGTYFALGAERSFEPGSYRVSTLWLGLSIAINLVAAIVGGRVCAAIARTPTPPKVLAAIVFLLSFVHGLMNALSPAADPGARAGDVDNFVAMTHAVLPTWFEFAAAFLGAIGVLIGARLRKRS